MPDLQAFKTAIDEANSILVALPSNPTQDVVAASLGLSLSLSSYGKKVTTIASSSPIVRDSHLVGLDKITSEVGGNNLVITFNLPEDAVDKVTSNTEGGHLNLVISPKKDRAAITKEDLIFSYSGAAADLVVVVGCNNMADLGSIYEKEIELFEKAKIVNFGKSTGTFGTVNMTDYSSSNSEFATAVISELHFPMTGDIANNLMLGIENSTSGLTSSDMTADTFEAIAVLYRNGAKRLIKQDFPQAKVISDTPIVDVEGKENKSPETFKTISEEKAQPDWMKPKIMHTGVSNK